MAHALVLQSGSHHSRALPPRVADFHLCQHLRLFGLQQGSLVGCSAHPVPLCSHSVPTLPKSLGNTEVKRREGEEIRLKCKPDSRTCPLQHKQLTYISCTTDTLHSNELAVHCIHRQHAFLCATAPQTARTFFFQTRGGYVMSYSQWAWMSTECKPHDSKRRPFFPFWSG